MKLNEVSGLSVQFLDITAPPAYSQIRKQLTKKNPKIRYKKDNLEELLEQCLLLKDMKQSVEKH